MITTRKSKDRGHGQTEWLDTYHSFSFGTYYDPNHMGFRTLRVINEDWVQPGTGFAKHAHTDMDILSFVLKGALKHKDNFGHEEVIRAGEVQRISAGTGIFHSEFNPSETEHVHFLQIWIRPDKMGLEPSYEKKEFVPNSSNTLQLLASKEGRDGSVIIHQDVYLYSGKLEADNLIEYSLGKDRHAWIQVIDGELEFSGLSLIAGDGAAVSEERILRFSSPNKTKFLLFDLS